MIKPVDDAIRSRLGARILTLRTARNLEQAVLGARVDCTQEYISQLERGERSPSWEILAGLAHKGFEIELAALMFGIDAPGPLVLVFSVCLPTWPLTMKDEPKTPS